MKNMPEQKFSPEEYQRKKRKRNIDIPSPENRRRYTVSNLGNEDNNTANQLAKKERHDITVEAYAERFGLTAVARDVKDGRLEWVACKFCPVFGSSLRDPGYIRAYRAPFLSKTFESHLEKEHSLKWKEYKLASPGEKERFFSSKVVPAQAFQLRVMELRTTSDGMGRQRIIPGITAEEENIQIDKALENLAKLQERRQQCQDGMAGRSMAMGQRQTPTEKRNKLPTLEMISKCFKELEIASDIAGLILHGIMKDSMQEEWEVNDRGFTDTIALEGEDMRPITLILSDISESIAFRVALALQYIHRGNTGSTCMAQDHTRIQGRPVRLQDGDRDVSRYGNALMALGMHILRRALATDCRNWAVGLTTRSCRFVGGGAVEVQISMYDEGREMRKAHLVTVQENSDAGAAVVEVLDVVVPSWKRRLLGLHSGICNQTQPYEKQIETAILAHIRKLTGRRFIVVDHGVSRDKKPIFPWTLSKMCESKFDALLSSIEGPLVLALGKARVRAAKEQRRELFKREMNVGAEPEAFREAWNIVGERAVEIYVIAEGLQTVWLCDCKQDHGPVTEGRRKGKGVVDCDAERVLWVRELVRLWKGCRRVVEELGMETL